MSEKSPNDEDEFIKQLRDSRNSAVPASKRQMILNKPPTGKNKSLSDLVDLSQKNDSNLADSFEKIENLSINLVDDSPFQPRLAYDESYIHSLGESLVAVGQKEAITVRRVGDRYQAINGHCRVRACRLIGWSHIDARVVTANDREAEISALVQNEAHKNLTDYERARFYQRALKANFASNQTQLAQMFGCTQARISQCLTMLDLPEVFLAVLDAHPALFGYRTAKTIGDLMKAHPNDEGLVLQAVMRLIDGADQSSIKGWVEQVLARRCSTIKKVDKAVVTNSNGQTIFTSRVKGRQVIVDFPVRADAQLIQKWIVAALREYADQVKEPVQT